MKQKKLRRGNYFEMRLDISNLASLFLSDKRSKFFPLEDNIDIDVTRAQYCITLG